MVTETRILDEPAVLVLGAGASKPQGFPLGSELKTAIVATYNDAVLKALREIGHSNEVIKEFQDALKFSKHPTIDIFLEAKTNFREIGAYFIAGTIGRYEMPDRLFPSGEWYGDLFQALDLEKGERDLPPISVVTLNYDRSLEHFLTKYIDYNCPHDCVELAHRKRQSLPIIHAHGSLGAYPNVEYGKASDSTEALRKAADSIKIVSDKLEESPDFRKAQQALSNAKHIVFLGFGYDGRTLGALLEGCKLGKKQFYGTAFQESSQRMDHIQGLFNNRITLGDNMVGCNGFLQRIGLVTEKGNR
jgi:hypothetical protein